MPYNDGDTINYYKTVQLYVKYNFYLDDSINYSLKFKFFHGNNDA